MTPAPASLEDLRHALADCHTGGTRVRDVDLSAFNRVLAHVPEDMTATVEAGITLETLNQQLAKRGQWLPLDPPFPASTTVAALVNDNASGPRRYGHGTIREHLIELAVVLADGRLIRSGAKVVKSVAGYDLHKLFVGSRGTLGVVVEATFKLQPLPESERFVQTQLDSLDRADALLTSISRSPLRPMVVDLFRLDANRTTGCTLILGFAGSRESVEEQLARAGELGMAQPASIDAEDRFWTADSPVRRRSVLPSKTIECIRELGDVPFLARAGNGVIHYRGGPEPPKFELPRVLMKRVKEAFDPRHLFPDWPDLARKSHTPNGELDFRALAKPRPDWRNETGISG